MWKAHDKYVPDLSSYVVEEMILSFGAVKIRYLVFLKRESLSAIAFFYINWYVGFCSE